MAQNFTYRPEVRRRQFRTLSMICEEEPLSEAQLKAYQSRTQEYQAFLECVGRLAMCGNVCVTEEAVSIGDSGLLTGESLNALQHAGAISVYNTLQQNNWEFSIPEDSEVAVVKASAPVAADDFLDSEKPIRPDWPSIHVTDCFIDGDRPARLHGSVRPLRAYLPPSVTVVNPADPDFDLDLLGAGVDLDQAAAAAAAAADAEPDEQQQSAAAVQLVTYQDGIAVKHMLADGSQVADYSHLGPPMTAATSTKCIPIDEYYFGRQDGSYDYTEEKGDFRFKCAICQRIFYSNVKLMSHLLSHIDAYKPFEFTSTDPNTCNVCDAAFANQDDLQAHIQHEHDNQTDIVVQPDPEAVPVVAPTASQLLARQRISTSGDGQPTDAAPLAGYQCRICGRDTPDELSLAQHLQGCHRRCEMPYVCRLCLFRSSLYEDILDHFKESHANSNHLLCTYCLRIFTPPDAHLPSPADETSGGSNSGSLCQTQVYLQHLRMHHSSGQLRRCPSCKLTFVNKSDYQVHRRLDHKAARSGKVPASTASGSGAAALGEEFKPAIQAETGDATTDQLVGEAADEEEEEHVTYIDIQTDGVGPGEEAGAESLVSQLATGSHVKLLNAPQAGGAKNLTGLKLPADVHGHGCLECGNSLGLPHHQQYVPCSVCRYATCCYAGYTQHVQDAHIYTDASRSATLDFGVPFVHPVDVACLPTASAAAAFDIDDAARAFYCTHCWVGQLTGNELARHMVEECGTSTATLNPDQALRARLHGQTPMDVDEEAGGESAMTDQTALEGQEEAQHQTNLLYQAFSAATGSVDQLAAPLAVDATAELDQQQLGEAVAMDQGEAVTTGGLPQTFDVTDADGQVVQQFIVPDDLQLEEGQTLVLIQGEDGQPQLAIVNQADLLEGDDSQLVLEGGEDPSAMSELYATQPDAEEVSYVDPSSAVVQPEDEKENHEEEQEEQQ